MKERTHTYAHTHSAADNGEYTNTRIRTPTYAHRLARIAADSGKS